MQYIVILILIVFFIDQVLPIWIAWIGELFGSWAIGVLSCADLVLGACRILPPFLSWAVVGFILSGLWYFAVFYADRTNRPQLKSSIMLNTAILCMVLGMSSLILSFITQKSSQRAIQSSILPLTFSQLNAQAQELVFFESGKETTPKKTREYSKIFSQQKTRYINYELRLKYPETPNQVDFKIEEIWYGPGEKQFAKNTVNRSIEKGWINSEHASGRGWIEAGHFALGVYRVELYIDGAKIASGSFEIRKSVNEAGVTEQRKSPDKDGHIKLPSVYIDNGACPFEGCIYGKWYAIENINIFDKIKGSARIGTIPKGKIVDIHTGEVHVVPNKVQILKDSLVRFYDVSKQSLFQDIKVKKNEELYLLTPLGEGMSKVWYAGKIYIIDANWIYVSSSHLPSECWGTVDRAVTMEWWAPFKMESGLHGWIKIDKNFCGNDQYGTTLKECQNNS